jgi:FAD/FMN-containing dehydrogenase
VRLGRALGDFVVPLDQLADCTEALGETFSRMGLKVTWTAKATPGTMHLRLFLPPQDGGVQTDGSLVQAVMDHVLGCQGAFSGECPAGAGTRDWLTRQFGDRLIQAMVAVKQAFDPRNRLSPGKIIGPD